MKTSENTIKQKVEKAISDIITYETLPSQIDYRVTEKAKAEEATLFLQTLPKGLQATYFGRIETELDVWNTRLACGNTPAELDEMF